ncbi:ANTAR domain-containing protein [Nocardia sp. NPDC051990]|uniref:ANTAR domain-containing protein n=1 Tax=Nocardia sp. NPDC051990 TaxID=3155285 RepID=UPI00343834F5
MIGTAGYYIDVTAALEERQQTLDDALPELYAARAVIEQAKGALMLVYGINAQTGVPGAELALAETNIKLRDLATRLIADLSAPTDSMAELRTRFDHLLLTAHERIEAD